ncbi:hypothetical protein BTJ40_06705 [Microbulbifer sp. A4B17]|uniref:hypothetical protein n=1 Tax=Microbulbifer sp. A4B17 TaxID=359370 RepID=UPI000D52EC43|nr:hypothetical protein [Microbulbifer sp. A4B17]AWF80522.1 hypothetical protein BTJ40_06705 [Microbulbifer sp. A4B17]
MNRLTKKEIFNLIDSIESEQLAFERVRPHNKGEIRKKDSLKKGEFKNMVSEAIEEGHQPGGGLELKIPSIKKTLFGYHDGIYRLE